MSPAELTAIGTRLYGKRWQTALARELGVTARTVRRWKAGQTLPLPMARMIELLLVMVLEHDHDVSWSIWPARPTIEK